MKVSILRHMEIEMNGDEYDVLVHGLQMVAHTSDGYATVELEHSPIMADYAKAMLEELAAADTKHMF